MPKLTEIPDRGSPGAEDTDAYFNKVYAQTFRKVTRFVVARCNGLNDCEDVVQEIYTRFFRRITKKGFADIDSPEAFLINIAKFECRSYLSNIIKHKRTEYFSEYSDEEFSYIETEMSKDSPMLDETVENELFTKHIYDDITKTDPIAGKIMYLYYAEDMKIETIAETLNMNISSVKTKLFRTLKRIKEKYSI